MCYFLAETINYFISVGATGGLLRSVCILRKNRKKRRIYNEIFIYNLSFEGYTLFSRYTLFLVQPSWLVPGARCLRISPSKLVTNLL